MRAESKSLKWGEKISALLDKLNKKRIFLHFRQIHNFSYFELNMQIIPVTEKDIFKPQEMAISLNLYIFKGNSVYYPLEIFFSCPLAYFWHTGSEKKAV